jgi:hypothetical protein
MYPEIIAQPEKDCIRYQLKKISVCLPMEDKLLF